jgi:hypothetical protein
MESLPTAALAHIGVLTGQGEHLDLIARGREIVVNRVA